MTFSTSRLEIAHLLGAIGGLGLVFAVALQEGERLRAVLPSPWILFVSLIATFTAFVPHELGHKLLAQRYGMFAEFRAAWIPLLLSGFFALATSLTSETGRGIVFIVPGAVLLSGHVTYRSHGLVSLMGPATNFVVAALAWPFAISVNPDTDNVAQVFHMVVHVNAIIGAFNLVPFGPLDGKKIWWWSRTAWVLSAIVAAAFLVAYVVVLGPPPV